MYDDVIAAIHPLLLVRSFVLGEWLARIVTTSTPNPADSTSDTFLLSLICIFKQLVQSYYRLSIKQQSADENPPTVRLAHSECNPHCQSKYWYESRKPTSIHLARHDAAADVRTSLVAPDTFLELPSAFSATLLHHHTFDGGHNTSISSILAKPTSLRFLSSWPQTTTSSVCIPTITSPTSDGAIAI